MPEYPEKGLRGSRKEMRLRPLTATGYATPSNFQGTLTVTTVV